MPMCIWIFPLIWKPDLKKYQKWVPFWLYHGWSELLQKISCSFAADRKLNKIYHNFNCLFIGKPTRSIGPPLLARTFTMDFKWSTDEAATCSSCTGLFRYVSGGNCVRLNKKICWRLLTVPKCNLKNNFFDENDRLVQAKNLNWELAI